MNSASKIFIFIATIVLLLTHLQSQPYRLVFNSFDQSNGLLSDEYNYFISQDSRGFIWIGSNKGLNKLAGNTTLAYQSKIDDPFSLPEILVQSRMYEDEYSDMWFSTYQHLCKYVRIKDHFEVIKLFHNGQELKGEHRVFFYERPSHSVWLSVGEHIYIYNTKTKDTQKLPFEIISKFFSVDTTSLGIVERIYGSPWITHGLEVISKNIDGDFSKATYGREAGSSTEIHIKKIIPQNDTLAWLFTNKGVIKFNRHHPGVRILEPGLPIASSYGTIIDSSHLMISMIGHGLLLYNHKKRKVVDSWKHDKNNVFSINSNSPEHLFLDKQQNLWINTKNNGVNSTTLIKEKFTQPQVLKTKNTSFVSLVYYDQNIWTLTLDKGIFVFDQNMDLIKHYSIEWLNQQGVYLSRKSKFYYHQNSNSLYIICTEGIRIFDNKTKNWTKIIDFQDRIESLCPISKDRLFFTTNKEVKEVNKNGNSFNVTDNLLFPGSVWFERFFATNYNKIITSCNGELLNIYDISKEEIRLDTSIKFKTYLTCEWEDRSRNILWLGTDLGLYKLNLQTNELSNISALSQDISIHSISGDDSGKIWFSAKKGIGYFDPSTQQLIKFNKEDGLPSYTFNVNSICEDNQNQIWMGATEGLIYLSPDSISPYPFAPKAYIANLTVNTLPFIGDTVVQEKKCFFFKSSENDLRFELNNTGFHQSDLNEIYFRLVGHSEEWQLYDPSNFALFSNLKSKDYRFEWKAVNSNGIESPIEYVTILISPPFHQTWPFWLLCFGLTATLTILITRWYFNKKIASQKELIEKQELIHQERNRIGSELHDDLGAGLSLIKVLTERIEGKFEDEKLNKRVHQISGISNDLHQSIADIIWALDTKEDAVKNLVQHIKIYAEKYLSMNFITLEFIAPLLDNNATIHGHKRRSIFLIVKECLHNIVKHANAQVVEITIDPQLDLLKIQIKDNGVGIDPNNMRKAGRGLKNLKKRATDENGSMEINSVLGEGTIINIEIPIEDSFLKTPST